MISLPHCHRYNFKVFSYSLLRIYISTFIISLIITFISSLFKSKKIRNFINILFVFIYSVYSLMQLGFINFLGVYISLHTSGQFGAVTDYIGDFMVSFKLIYYIILIPFILYVIYYIVTRKKKYYKYKFSKRSFILLFLLILSCYTYSKALADCPLSIVLQGTSQKYISYPKFFALLL